MSIRLTDPWAACPDDRQHDGRRLSSVQYLLFPVEGRTPVAIGIEFPAAQARTELSPEQRAALAEDLADDGARYA